MSDEDETERRALLQEHAALELEYKRVHGVPRDLEAHRELVTRLRNHSNRLHTFLERLRSRHQP
jgi:hypothetical protein